MIGALLGPVVLGWQYAIHLWVQLTQPSASEDQVVRKITRSLEIWGEEKPSKFNSFHWYNRRDATWLQKPGLERTFPSHNTSFQSPAVLLWVGSPSHMKRQHGHAGASPPSHPDPRGKHTKKLCQKWVPGHSLPAPSSWSYLQKVFSAQAPDVREQRQAILSVSYSNAWPTQGVSIINGCFASLTL